MTETEFVAAQRSAVLMEAARATVKRNHWTDKPGARWHLNELNYPRFNGIHNTVTIYANNGGTAYEVHTYTYAGDTNGAPIARKTLAAAFKLGEALADKG
jgi:hypothetical protein